MVKASTLCFVSPFTYRGYCYDYDIELYYLQSRYYSAEIGRFINADSTDYLGATGTVLSFNLFPYCENNPVNYADPSGYVAYGFISSSSGTTSLINKAKALFVSSANSGLFKITYTRNTIYDYKSKKFKTTYIPSHYYRSGKVNSKKSLVTLYYYNGNFRVQGSVYYRTALEWKLYVESRHMSLFTKLKTKFMDWVGIGDYEYSLFMDALYSMVQGTRFQTIFEIANIIDSALDFIAAYRDKLDKTILKIIKNARANQYIMIVFSASYQQYRYVTFPFKKGWVTVNTKKIY